MKVSLLVSGLSRLFAGDLARLVELARAAEAAGVDQIAVPDHVAMGPNADRYPYGRFPLPLDEPFPEPLTTLAAMAGATSRIRLGTGILIAPLRPAVLLAKTLATLDVLSGGRVELGVGVGWQEEEYAASGVPFDERWGRLDDTLRACQALWTEAPASFHSRSVSFEKLWSSPHPVQEGGIPIWFGVAATPRQARRIAELGAGWMPMPLAPDELRAGADRIREAFARAGRDPATLGVRASVRSFDEVESLREAGATALSFPLAAFAHRADEIPTFLERLGGMQP